MRRFDVYLMAPYASWEGVRAENEKDALGLCRPGIWPCCQPPESPRSFITIEVETVAEGEGCHRCGEDRVDWLLWDLRAMEIECLSCDLVYQLD